MMIRTAKQRATNRRALAAAALLLPVAAGCTGDVVEITESRVVETPFARGLRKVSSAARFGAVRRDASSPHGRSQAPPRFRGEVPQSWREQKPTTLRDPHYEIGVGVSCWLTVLAGEGGGLSMNINRWRAQMGLEPIQDDEIGKLPKLRLESLAVEATRVDIEGAYSPRGADAPKPGYRMLALVIPHEGHTLFLRMTGPEAAVEAERKSFERLADTLKPLPGSRAGGSADSGKSSLDWNTPEGWTQKATSAPKMGGLAEFTIDDETRCTISAAGGGLGPNTNRWRSQMGHESLSAAAVEKLPGIEVLGKAGKLIELTGNYAGMRDEAVDEAMLIGAIVPGFGRVALFVKLIGPKATVQKHRAKFLAFCKSLRWAQ